MRLRIKSRATRVLGLSAGLKHPRGEKDVYAKKCHLTAPKFKSRTKRPVESNSVIPFFHLRQNTPKTLHEISKIYFSTHRREIFCPFIQITFCNTGCYILHYKYYLPDDKIVRIILERSCFFLIIR